MPLYDIDDLDLRDPRRIERMARVTERFIIPFHRARVTGIRQIPTGPALYVGNHNGGLYSPDTVIFAHAVYRQLGLEHVPYGLAHEVVLRHPIVNRVLVPAGAVRASHENAERLLSAGRKVMVYPGGELDSLRPFRLRDRIVFGGRRGYMRLALRCGVPIVPVVAAGAHATFIVLDDLRWLARLLRTDRLLRLKVWPLVLSFPWGLTLGPPLPHIPWPSRILVEVLPPMRFDPVGDAATRDEAHVARCAARVETAMQDALTALARQR